MATKKKKLTAVKARRTVKVKAKRPRGVYRDTVHGRQRLYWFVHHAEALEWVSVRGGLAKRRRYIRTYKAPHEQPVRLAAMVPVKSGANLPPEVLAVLKTGGRWPDVGPEGSLLPLVLAAYRKEYPKNKDLVNRKGHLKFPKLTNQ